MNKFQNEAFFSESIYFNLFLIEPFENELTNKYTPLNINFLIMS